MIEPQPKATWRISPYPNGYDFAFTIVHDADDAYSERLAPLFDVFNKYGFKISVTAFAFWGEDFKNKKVFEETPEKDRFYKAKAVPLEVPSEREFYKKLESKGHEIGLHTATNLSDTRDTTKAAFEYFKEIFGHYPDIYVEHRDTDNMECVQNEGANPESKFYVVDLLNHYGPWVWIISPSALPYEGKGRYYDLLDNSLPFFSDTALKYYGIFRGFYKEKKIRIRNGNLYLCMVKGGTLFDKYAKKKYGLVKAFRRSGRSDCADGNGFLKCYSKKNIDELERHNGVAIVYTHLNTNWIDINTKKIRSEIEERLKYIASKNVWLATASEILDRFKAMSKINISYDDKYIAIINESNCMIKDITICCPNNKTLIPINDKANPISYRGSKIIVTLEPRRTASFKIKDSTE